MQVNFLGASDGTALAKTFKEIAPGTYEETSYPSVARFNSIERPINKIEDFYTAIVACSNESLCLLKGALDRPLLNESRAGHTNSSGTTEWLCLDVDYTVRDQTPEEFLRGLGLGDVGFVFQKSASMGIKSDEGWRGHFFLLLDSSQSPPALKQWLIHLNLSSPSLQDKIGLSASGGALTYPLDISTCQNDKLIYIAPPNCVGFADPLAERFALSDGPKLKLDATKFSAAKNQEAIKKLLVEKRSKADLPTKTFKTTQHFGTEILTNPDAVTVTGRKEERGFVYLNLNGGDSWGYFFPTDNPDILFNFKGEPCMYVWDVDRDIYNEYRQQNQSVDVADGDIPFGFLWPDNDTYYRGFANPTTKKLTWLCAIGSKTKLQDFFIQNGTPVKSSFVVDEWQLEFDPTTDGFVDFQKRTVNTYSQTDFIRNAGAGTDIPPVIDRVLSSVCTDEEAKQHFINWLASIFQTRQKTNTAWLFQGVEGTGKGVLFTHIISPLIGEDYCHEMTMDRMDDDYNDYLSDNIILFIDEANISDSKREQRMLNRIKNLVTEPTQHIRGMRRNAIKRRNYTNIILASNYDEIIPMSISDRRFNVAPRQEQPIQLTYDDIFSIKSELAEFANYLHSFQVDTQKVTRVLLSDARDKLINLSETTVDAFFHAVKSGDLQYFTQFLDNSIKGDIESIRYHDFVTVVTRWIETAGKQTNVTRTELRTCYQSLQNISISATKFGRMCSKYAIENANVRIGDHVGRGQPGVMWVLSDEELARHKEKAASNVVSFNKEKL